MDSKIYAYRQRSKFNVSRTPVVLPRSKDNLHLCTFWQGRVAFWYATLDTCLLWENWITCNMPRVGAYRSTTCRCCSILFRHKLFFFREAFLLLWISMVICIKRKRQIANQADCKAFCCFSLLYIFLVSDRVIGYQYSHPKFIYIIERNQNVGRPTQNR